MNPISNLYITIAIVSLVIGIYVYLFTNNRKLKLLFLFFTLAGFYWGFTGFLLRSATGYEQAQLFQKIGGLWPFCIAIFVHFTLFYTHKIKFLKHRILFYILIYLPAIVFSYFELISDNINIVTKSALGYWTSAPNEDSLLYLISTTWSWSIPTLAVLIALRHLVTRKDKREKKQAGYVFLGLLMPVAFSTIIESFSPLLVGSIVRMTVPGYGIGLVFIGYAIAKYDLFNITESTVAEKVISTIPEMLIVLNKNKKIQMVNNGTEKKLGYNSNQIIGNTADFLFNDESIKKAILNFEVITNLETDIINKKGMRIPVKLSTNAIKSEDNKEEHGLIILARDISKSKKTNRELEEHVKRIKKSELAMISMLEDIKISKEEIQKQNIELKKLDQLKNNFINVTSHELRTPMASIKGYVQMLLKQKLGNITKEEKNALEIVLRNTNRLDKLIQDILDLSRLESGNMKYIPEKADIKSLITEVQETMSAKSEEKKIKIKTEVDKEIPPAVIDPEKIRQVMMNLVDNSIKFSDDGTVINLKAKKEKDDILIEIQDFGRGVPEKQKDKVFETFYQVDSGEDRKYGGTGLGLAISKSIIQAHGGNIWVESKGVPREGSSFKFTIPFDSEKAIRQTIREQDMFKVENNKNK